MLLYNPLKWYHRYFFVGSTNPHHADRIIKTIDEEFSRIVSGLLRADDRLMFRLIQEAAKESVMAMFRDLIGKKIDGTPGRDFSDPDFAQVYPVLHQFLTQPVDDDGKPRQLASIILFVEQGVAKAGLRERDAGLSLWVSADTLLGVYEALELQLSQSPVPWRASGPSGTTRRVKT